MNDDNHVLVPIYLFTSQVHLLLSCKVQHFTSRMTPLYGCGACRMQTVRTKEEKEVLEHFAGVVSNTNTRTSLYSISSTRSPQPEVVALRYSIPG